MIDEHMSPAVCRPIARTYNLISWSVPMKRGSENSSVPNRGEDSVAAIMTNDNDDGDDDDHDDHHETLGCLHSKVNWLYQYQY